MSLVDSTPMTLADFESEYKKTEARRATEVYVAEGKSEVVKVILDAKLEKRTFMKNDKSGKYSKFAVPVEHESVQKVILLFFDDTAALYEKAKLSGGTVTVTKNLEGRFSFT